jgi:hypothetical protein
MNSKKVSILKEQLLELLESSMGKRFNIEIAAQVFMNRGFTSQEFTKAYNDLVMDSKISSDGKYMWLIFK